MPRLIAGLLFAAVLFFLPAAAHAETEAPAITDTELSAASSGSIRSAAEAEARRFGLVIRWVNGPACPGNPRSIGCFYPGQGNEITITANGHRTAEQARNTVRHEAAHNRITSACGATRPAIIPNGRHENVTDAYAAQYHGMNGQFYGFTSADTRIAQQIKAGVCTKSQRTITVPAAGAVFHMRMSSHNTYASGERVLARGETITYFYAKDGWAQIRDSRGYIGYAPLGVASKTSTLRQVKITTPLYTARTMTGDSITMKAGDTVRLTSQVSSNGWTLGITGNGTFAYIRGDSYAKPKRTATILENAVIQIYRGGGTYESCAGCIKAGTAVDVMSDMNASYANVVYKGTAYAVSKTGLGSAPSKPSPANPSRPSSPDPSEPKNGTTSVQVHRFWSSKFANAHFYTANQSEAKTVRSNDQNWRYEGASFRAYLPTNGRCASNTRGVYRFWSPKFESHFYSTNVSEVHSIRMSDSNWTFEGVVFCEPSRSGKDTTAVYRFWSHRYQKHFYTANAAEMRSIKANDPAWRYEGIAWYAPTK